MFILTMVILLGGDIHGTVTSFSTEYSSKQACEAAKTANREALSAGKVLLATCTQK